MKKYTENQTKESVIASPKDEILTGIVTDIEQGALKEFLDVAVHPKFDNLDQETLKINFEVKFNDKIIKASDRIAYYRDPMTNSKLGKYLTKYNSIQVGQEIKIIYGSDGFGKIKVD